MNDKKWKLKNIKTIGSSLELKLKLSDKSNFSELLSIISILGIDSNNVYIEDPYFGTYTPL